MLVGQKHVAVTTTGSRYMQISTTSPCVCVCHHAQLSYTAQNSSDNLHS